MSLIDAVDHGTSLGEEDDFVGALDLAGLHHRLLAIDHVETCGLQCKEHTGFCHIHANPLPGEPF